jgi:hypothetical protein
VKWKSTPLIVLVAGVGRGGGRENGAAHPAAGDSNPLPSVAPPAAAAPPMNARRESP